MGIFDSCFGNKPERESTLKILLSLFFKTIRNNLKSYSLWADICSLWCFSGG